MVYNTLSSIHQLRTSGIFASPRGYQHSTANRRPASKQAPFSNIFSEAQARVTNRKYKTRGLTIADYRAHPVFPKSRFKAPLPPTADANNDSTLNRIATRSASTTRGKESRPQIDTDIKKRVPANRTALKIEPLRSVLTDSERIEDSIQKAAAKYSLPPGLIRAVIRAESNFQVDAVSPAGAEGLMQLMPTTARELGVTDSFDISQNIDGGAKYLRSMLNRFDGNVSKALAAYNAGPGTVIKYNGRVPYPETRRYVKRVLQFSRLMV